MLQYRRCSDVPVGAMQRNTLLLIHDPAKLSVFGVLLLTVVPGSFTAVIDCHATACGFVQM